MLGRDLYFMQKRARQEGDKTRGMIKKKKFAAKTRPGSRRGFNIFDVFRP